MSEKTFEINFAAVAQFEFYSSNNSDEVEAAFEDKYGAEGEPFGGAVMGTGGSWKRTRFAVDEEVPEELSTFESVRTYLAPDNRHVYDAITVGRLAPETVQDILDEERGRAEGLIEDSMKALQAFTDDVPVVPEGEDSDTPSLFYVEPTEKLNIGQWGEKGLDTEATSEWLEDHRDLLQQLNILLGHPISLIGTEDLFVPQGMGAGYIRRATVLNTSATHTEEGKDVMGPLWLRRLEGALKAYYRADCWLNYRRKRISDIDEQTHGTDRLLDGNEADLKAYQSAEEEIEELRKSWIDQYTLIRDEVAEIEGDFRLDKEKTPSPEREIPISPPARDGDESIYLTQEYDDHVQELLNLAQDDMDRIGEKLDRFSQFIHDSVSARTAATNVELQADVKRLTKLLYWLTAVLAVVGVLQFGIAVWPLIY